jgi:protein gp37
MPAGEGPVLLQWGGKNKKKAGRLLEGRIWSQMPPDREKPRRAA